MQEPRDPHGQLGTVEEGIGAAQYHLGQEDSGQLHPPLQLTSQGTSSGDGIPESASLASSVRPSTTGSMARGVSVVGSAAGSRRVSRTEGSRLGRRTSSAHGSNPIMLAAAAVAAAAESFVGYAMGAASGTGAQHAVEAEELDGRTSGLPTEATQENFQGIAQSPADEDSLQVGCQAIVSSLLRGSEGGWGWVEAGSMEQLWLGSPRKVCRHAVSAQSAM